MDSQLIDISLILGKVINHNQVSEKNAIITENYYDSFLCDTIEESLESIDKLIK